MDGSGCWFRSSGPGFLARRQVMKPDQINVFTFSVLRDFEQIEHSKKAGRPRQRRSDVGKPDRLDGIDLNLAFVHGIPPSHLYVRADPYPDAAGNLTAPDSIAQAFGKNHGIIFSEACAAAIQASWAV